MNKIYIGPAGWRYDDWKGVVYPSLPPKGFSELSYLARFFNTIEINSSFYRIPNPNHVKNWIEQVRGNSEFLFTIKLWQEFTHDRSGLTKENLGAFVMALDVLQDHKKLGALLIQFPWRFKRTTENSKYITKLAREFAAYPCAIEFRHESWNDPQIHTLLQENKLGWVNLDQPVIGSSIAPGRISTFNLGYVRLHGRNYQDWFNEQAGRDNRYDYLYKESELAEWIDHVKSIAGSAERTFVIFNNHFRGQAVVNSLQFSSQLVKRSISIPSSLIKNYPALREIGTAEDTGITLELF